MKVGDKVKIRNYKDPDRPNVYTIIEIDENSIKLKHADIGGYFIFDKASVVEVIKKINKKI